MKKKLVLLAVMSVFLLVGCSSKDDDLSGKWYSVFKSDASTELVLEIDNNSGTIDVDGVTYSITNIDTDKKQITVNAGSNYVIPYTYEDGVLTLTEDSMYGSSYKVVCYKENSKALEEAIEEAKDDD